MLLVTGDTHGNFSRFSKRNYGKYLDVNDIVIICGDFGLLWEEDKEFLYWRKFFEERDWTTLFVSGNHENYNMLENYPIEKWNGGNIRRIGEKIIHLERGQIFEIQGKKIFTFGGASSHDIEGGILNRNDDNFRLKATHLRKRKINFRVLNESWWERELPNEKEMQEGLENLARYNNEVDIIISHCCSNITQANFGVKGKDILTDYFDKIEEIVSFKHWYFGHYHQDRILDNKHTIMYHDLKEVRI